MRNQPEEHGQRPLIDVVGQASFLGDGSRRPYVNLDNAATTPICRTALTAIARAMEAYGSVRRGSGIKSAISTDLFEHCIEVASRFVGAGEDAVVVLAGNSTGAINRLAQNLRLSHDDVVVVSRMEHSSNILPWAKVATVEYLDFGDRLRFDLNRLESTLRTLAGAGRRISLVAMTGASNVTGELPAIHEAARIAHRFGAKIFVDCAQLAAHREIQMKQRDRAADIDFVALSGHKMYAPAGAGILVGPRSEFACDGYPDHPGGGTVEMIDDGRIIWSGVAERLGAGTPNLMGLVAFAAAAVQIRSLGEETIRSHEAALISKARKCLSCIPGIRLIAEHLFDEREDRLPIFAFQLDGIAPGLLAATLGHEYNVAVRHGHLCQFQLIRRLLHIQDEEHAKVVHDLEVGDRTRMYGVVRASCGLSTTTHDLHLLAEALTSISRNGPQREYRSHATTGLFRPLTGEPSWKDDPVLRPLLDPGPTQ